MSHPGRGLRRHSASSSSSAATNSPFRAAFNVLDVDRDGKISHDDLCSFHDMFRRSEKGDVIEWMMAVADTDGDGFVDYEEFKRVLGMADGPKSSWGGGVVEEVFRMMDMHDGDGKLSHKDLKSFMELAGIPVTDQDIDDMMALGGGGDRNDGVTFDGFMGILLGPG